MKFRLSKVLMFFMIGSFIICCCLNDADVMAKRSNSSQNYRCLATEEPINEDEWLQMSQEEKNEKIDEIYSECLEGNDLSQNEEICSSVLSDSSEVNALSDKSLEEIETYFQGLYCGKSNAPSDNETGGIITSPITYLHNTVGKEKDTYTVSKSVSCYGVTRTKMSSLRSGENNCTLTALYNEVLSR